MHGATSLRYNYKVNSSNKELVCNRLQSVFDKNSEALCAKVGILYLSWIQKNCIDYNNWIDYRMELKPNLKITVPADFQSHSGINSSIVHTVKANIVKILLIKEHHF